MSLAPPRKPKTAIAAIACAVAPTAVAIRAYYLTYYAERPRGSEDVLELALMSLWYLLPLAVLGCVFASLARGFRHITLPVSLVAFVLWGLIIFAR